MPASPVGRLTLRALLGVALTVLAPSVASAQKPAGKAPAKAAPKAASKTAAKTAAKTAPKPAKPPAPKVAAPEKPKAPPPPPELLFTFDDGPHLERTPKVLKTLEQYGIHAVFFVNGMRFQGTSQSADKARELLRDEVARGHAVGNHTIHHFFLCGVRGPKIATDEIEGNAKLIEDAIGKRPELYRTPYGSHCPTLAATLAQLGVRHTSWDIDPQDWKVQNTDKVRDYVTRYLHGWKHGRRILLMHDIHQDTVEALPQILEFIKKENAERVKSGELPIRIIDYAYLLPPHPAVPPILEGIGRILIDSVVPPAARALIAAAMPVPRS